DATDVSEVDGGGIDGARGDGGRARHGPGVRAGSQRAARYARGNREADGHGRARRGARPGGSDGRAACGHLRLARPRLRHHGGAPSGPRRPARLIPDESRLVALVTEYLGRHEIDVTVAADGERGLSVLRKGRFDVVLLDVMLPGADGFEVCRRLRAAPELATVPVIMLTAR